MGWGIAGAVSQASSAGAAQGVAAAGAAQGAAAAAAGETPASVARTWVILSAQPAYQVQRSTAASTSV